MRAEFGTARGGLGMKLIFEKSQPGRRASSFPKPDVPIPDVPEDLRRKKPPRLPELSEPEVVRHFTALADRTFGVDTGFYPLGSCTMKHNPRVNERVVNLPGFRDLHPLQEEDGAQGALELMWRLQGILAEVVGLDAVSLQPAAGSQGELTGLMLMRAYFADRGETGRDTIFVADTAHGTNPASVTMAGYSLQKVGTDERGNLDLEFLRANVNERTAGLMLTNPSTLGLFDEAIEDVARIFHDAGALLYYDGANLNAVCGISRPGDMGFDIVHYNLHKTFSQPHGGGGPGGGPIAVREVLEPFLPVPVVARAGEEFRFDYDRPKTIGKVRGYYGPFGVFVRSYAFIRSYGPRLREMSEVAVLNANYLLARLRDAYDLPFDRLCMHEFVLSARNLKRDHGVTALDVAKRLMDYGFHPPTIYFPLIVPEALMIEPTETEPKEALDGFVAAMLAIAREAAENRELVKEAPHHRPVRRLDEVKAAKRAILKYQFDEHPDMRGEPAEGEAIEAQKGA
jgi:glycine dehydrogenase subunit 2